MDVIEAASAATSELSFAVVTLGFLFIKVAIAWELYVLLVKINARLQWLWEGDRIGFVAWLISKLRRKR